MDWKRGEEGESILGETSEESYPKTTHHSTNQGLKT